MENDKLNYKANYFFERRRRLRTVMTILPAFIGFVIWLLTSGLNRKYVEYELGVRHDFLLVVVVVLLAFSGVSLILTYLQTGFKRHLPINIDAISAIVQKDLELQNGYQEDFRKQKLELASLRSELQETRAGILNLDEHSRANILADLRSSLLHGAATSVLEEVSSQVRANEQKNLKDRDLTARLDQPRLRLKSELDALGRRGNLNLALGAITTVVGISLLGFSVFSEASTAKDIWNLASHFLPRLALVLLIEIFAFFFLSLYKSSLSEIKYFQNELTNIESKQLALSAAIESKDPALLADVIDKLASTERNHILSKDQTTIELEKVRIDRESQMGVVKAVAEFFQKKE